MQCNSSRAPRRLDELSRGNKRCDLTIEVIMALRDDCIVRRFKLIGKIEWCLL